MRNGPAFNIVPQLVGDVAKVFSLSHNPSQLYVEASVETIHMACSVFELIKTRKNTQALEKMLSQVKTEYLENLSIEKAKELEIKYDQVKQSIEDKRFSDETVRSFISLLQRNIWQIGESIKTLEIDPEDPQWDDVQEIYRRTLRDNNRLLKICIEEDSTNG